MEYEWDQSKATANAAKHGVTFADVAKFDWDSAIATRDMRHTAEDRQIALGLVGNRLHVLVYTQRGTACRVISFRKANRREVIQYLEVTND